MWALKEYIFYYTMLNSLIIFWPVQELDRTKRSLETLTANRYRTSTLCDLSTSPCGDNWTTESVPILHTNTVPAGPAQTRLGPRILSFTITRPSPDVSSHMYTVCWSWSENTSVLVCGMNALSHILLEVSSGKSLCWIFPSLPCTPIVRTGGLLYGVLTTNVSVSSGEMELQSNDVVNVLCRVMTLSSATDRRAIELL